MNWQIVAVKSFCEQFPIGLVQLRETLQYEMQIEVVINYAL